MQNVWYWPRRIRRSLGSADAVANQLGVISRISTPGKIDKSEVATWMDMGDIFLNTTDADNTPITVLEAMACGLCVVSTKVVGIPYLLKEEDDALFIPTNDAAAMAKGCAASLRNRV